MGWPKVSEKHVGYSHFSELVFDKCLGLVNQEVRPKSLHVDVFSLELIWFILVFVFNQTFNMLYTCLIAQMQRCITYEITSSVVFECKW